MHTFASRVEGAVLDCQRYMAMVKLTLREWVLGSLALVTILGLAGLFLFDTAGILLGFF